MIAGHFRMRLFNEARLKRRADDWLRPRKDGWRSSVAVEHADWGEHAVYSR